MKRTLLLFLLILSATCLAVPNLLHAQNDTSSTFRSRADNPQTLRNYVVDETGTLTNAQINALSSKLKQFEDQTTNQLVVYMIPSLDGEAIEDVSMSIVEKNKMGRKDRDNGVLLLIAKNDRKMRIEVGYGLEGALTDATSSSIIRNVIAPSFKQGNFYDGISSGVDAIISATKGEYKADNKPGGKKSSGACMGVPFFVMLIFIIIFIFIFTSMIRSMFGRGRKLYGSRKGWSAVPWIISSGSSKGSSWGSSGGFGGFSGGGGSFGGGGASGSW